ncbi:VCBS repeat-containing protein [Heliobacillus mobilis]|uniref:VCBS repeat-containing protein n=1 Tax=Heliobacterium mobile TaxID=28064 RepID=A0A6I3SPP7_HELMO|nr:VCBS repeat-containing protein [Heliobacterium mobile]MTV50665.1 VCBS repeat-containing protein [Heliobacterium mobile]
MFRQGYGDVLAAQTGRVGNVLSSQTGDVNGDQVPDWVYLTGNYPYPGSQFVDNITLNIQDGRTMMTYAIPLKANAGYNPTVFLGDFTGDQVKDIQISVASGGSGGITYEYVYSFLNNQGRQLFDFEQFNEEYRYDVNYLDNYQVEVISRNLNKSYRIDIRYKGTEYLSEIYDKNGKLKAPIQGDVNGIGGLYPVDFERDGIYELLAFQRIIGRYNADGLGYMMNALKWNGSAFVPFQQWVGIFG